MVISNYSQHLTRQGGILPRIREYEYKAAHTSKHSLFMTVLATGTLALEIEPKNDRGVAIDPLLLSAHAFKRGMLIGNPLVTKLYNGQVEAYQIREALRQAVAQKEIEDEGSLLSAPPMLEMGQNGLDLLGPLALSIVEGWGRAVAPTASLQQLFTLGVGVDLSVADAITTNQAHTRVRESIRAKSLDEELKEVLDSNPGE